jgi:cysteine desulfurase
MSSKKRLVYLDHAATTLLDPEVFLAMKPYFAQNFGNPSSLYKLGVEAYKAIENSRKTIAHILHALPDTIIFTSGGTESANMAILGIARAHKKQGKHIITTAIEHHAVLNPIRELEKEGFKITYLPVDKNGLVKTADVVKAVTPDTILISIMYANNEIGTIEPIAEIGREILKYRKKNNTLFPYLHTDACQAAGYLDLDVEKLHVDAMTINGSKIYGPKGTGMLYVRNGVSLQPVIVGGGQEYALRSGTENLAGIVGFAKALMLVQKNKAKESKRIEALTRYFWQQIQKKISGVLLHGPELGVHRLVNNLNVQIAGIEGEALLFYLDAHGIMCSIGSACASKTHEPSHVLKALGVSYQNSKGSVRFSLGAENTKQQIDYVMKFLPKLVEQLRQIEKIT